MARRRNAGKARNIRLVRNVSPDKARRTPCRFDLGNQRGPLFLASAARNQRAPAAAIANAAPRPIPLVPPVTTTTLSFISQWLIDLPPGSRWFVSRAPSYPSFTAQCDRLMREELWSEFGDGMTG
jgi:hypothetical protein